MIILLTMGVKDACSLLKDGKGTSHSLSAIRRQHGVVNPVVAVDVSIYLHKAKASVGVLRQVFMVPPVPVTEVVKHFSGVVTILRHFKFDALFVFDGKYHPGKADTHRTRYHDRETLLVDLEIAYQDEETTFDDIEKLQKAAAHVREDMIYEIVQYARAESIPIIGAPFEADSQIHSLLLQNIADYALTNDGDIAYQGAPRTIMDLQQNGRCNLVRNERLLQTKLKELFQSPRDLEQRDLTMFACFQGNDYVANTKGDGKAKNIKRMQEWVKLTTQEEKNEFISNYLASHKAPNQTAFRRAIELWEKSPAFFVTPSKDNDSPRIAFMEGNYNVDLRAMSGDPESVQDQWWINDSDETTANRLGFIPSAALNGEADYKDMFTMNIYSKTGSPLEGNPPQYNEKGDELCPGSTIDFDLRPAPLIHEDQLLFWLACRGIANSNFSSLDAGIRRPKIIEAVEKAVRLNLPPLPKFLLRGGGGYIKFQVLEPRQVDVSPIWSTGDGFLDEMRSWKVPTINDQYFTSIFGKRNGVRARCLMHLDSGSFDLKDLKSTTGMRNNMSPNDAILVVEGLSAPSQRLGDKGMYSVTLAFKLDSENQTTKFLPHPVSSCTCANGCFFCAHIGALFLLLSCFQKRPTWTMEDCLAKLPESIHSLVSLPVLVELAFPGPTSTLSEEKKEIQKEMLKRFQSELGLESDSTEEDNDQDSSGPQIRDENGEQVLSFAFRNEALTVPDVSSSPEIKVCEEVTKWILLLESSEDISGAAQRLNVQKIKEAASEAACEVLSPKREKQQLRRLLALYELAEEDLEFRSLITIYVKVVKDQIDARLEELRDVEDIVYDSTNKD